MRTISKVLILALVAAALLALGAPSLAADDKKDRKEEKKSGTVVGRITAKGDNWVEVRADGEEKARRYVPYWVGGAPAQGGGPDKKMVEVIRGLKVGSRVRLAWEFEERARVVKVEVLQPADAKEGEKKGTVVGKLTAKDDKGIEVKADGEEKGRRYAFHFGGTPELHKAIKDAALGSRVRIEWTFIERPRVLKLEVLKAGGKDDK
jgi:hypothetical protein